jgi:hypothetical protein
MGIWDITGYSPSPPRNRATAAFTTRSSSRNSSERQLKQRPLDSRLPVGHIDWVSLLLDMCGKNQGKTSQSIS